MLPKSDTSLLSTSRPCVKGWGVPPWWMSSRNPGQGRNDESPRSWAEPDTLRRTVAKCVNCKYFYCETEIFLLCFWKLFLRLRDTLGGIMTSWGVNRVRSWTLGRGYSWLEAAWWRSATIKHLLASWKDDNHNNHGNPQKNKPRIYIFSVISTPSLKYSVLFSLNGLLQFLVWPLQIISPIFTNPALKQIRHWWRCTQSMRQTSSDTAVVSWIIRHCSGGREGDVLLDIGPLSAALQHPAAVCSCSSPLQYRGL